jgi:septal ring factor EnvC (AmiA/AmiB activator)
MKWKQKLAECNLTEETISAGLRSKIKDYYTIVEGIEEVEQSIKNPSINDDVDDLQDELEDLQTAMENADKQLIRAIEIYDKNKEKYAELSKNLGKGRPRKNPIVEAPKVVAQSVAAAPQQEVVKPIVEVAQGTVVEKEEKKSSWKWLLAIAVVGGLTLGVVNLSKRE